MKAKETVARLLMAFVLVSIGFVAGKETAVRAALREGGNHPGNLPAAGQAATEGDKVVLYYMHATFRCFTCNSIETMAKEVVDNEYSEALADGRLEWRVVNFQEDMAMGRRYGVGTSTLVIARFEDGREVEFQRLDEVWQKVNNPPAFKQFVDERIQAFLQGGAA